MGNRAIYKFISKPGNNPFCSLEIIKRNSNIYEYIR